MVLFRVPVYPRTQEIVIYGQLLIDDRGIAAIRNNDFKTETAVEIVSRINRETSLMVTTRLLLKCRVGRLTLTM